MSEIHYQLERYICNPEEFWDDGSVFAKRNIDKISQHRRELLSMGIEITAYVRKMVSFLELRKKISRTAVYVQSCGGSGCHFIGSLISSATNIEMINEVYIPKDFKLDPSLIDFVNIFHSRKKLSYDPTTVLVNTAHLRPDFDPRVTKSLHQDNLVTCLIRNPLDIVKSLVFRKQSYRDLTSPEVSDLDYFLGRCNHVLKFYSNVDDTFDDYFIYENFSRLALSNLKIFFKRHHIPFIDSDVSEMVRLNNASLGNAKGAINFNPEKRKPLGTEFERIYIDILASVAKKWGY